MTAFLPSDSSSSDTIARPCSRRYLLIDAHIERSPSFTRLNNRYMHPRSRFEGNHHV